MGIESAKIVEFLERGTIAATHDARGKVFEQLACYLFEQVPGCFAEQNQTNPLGAGQVDVLVGNNGDPSGLPHLPPAFVVECKDWSEPMDSVALGYFCFLLESRKIELGIVLSSLGLTGSQSGIHAAHSIALSAATMGRRLVLLTRDDLLRLQTTEDFTAMLTRRYTRAALTGALGLGPPFYSEY